MEDPRFTCNVCLDTVKEPVITQCGHLYCWPCLYRWLSTHHATCPVCKAGVTMENVIPLFVKGNEGDETVTSSSNEYVPQRPPGRRPIVDDEPTLQSFGHPDIGTITMSPSIGYFPSLFGLQFQSFSAGITSDGRVVEEMAAETSQTTNQLIFMGCFVFACLLLI